MDANSLLSEAAKAYADVQEKAAARDAAVAAHADAIARAKSAYDAAVGDADGELAAAVDAHKEAAARLDEIRKPLLDILGQATDTRVRISG